MKLIRSVNTSLRVRLLFGTGIMLLPLVLVSAGAFYATRSVVSRLENVVQREIRVLEPVSELQKLLLRTAMPPNDYLILGSSSEKRLYKDLSGGVDRAFAAFLASPRFEKETGPLTQARDEWEQARVLGDRIVALSNPVGNRQGGQLMKVFDGHIDRAAELLDKVHTAVLHDIDVSLSSTRAVARRTAVFMISMFLAGLAVAAASGVLLARSIIVPLKALEDGIFRFSQGDHSFRVVLDRTDELGQLARTMNVMAERLEYDSLTGVYNRREFLRKLKTEVERSLRYGRVFSVLMMDIDHFKAVNDTYGHQSGDDALRALAAIAFRELRSADIIARYGGEEFAFILPETVRVNARSVAERIRAQIEAQPVMIPQGKVLNMTVSIGVAAFPEDARSEDEILFAADQAMYAAKRAGRNRVESFVRPA